VDKAVLVPQGLLVSKEAQAQRVLVRKELLEAREPLALALKAQREAQAQRVLLAQLE
jgi:hypothetical protein